MLHLSLGAIQARGPGATYRQSRKGSRQGWVEEEIGEAKVRCAFAKQRHRIHVPKASG
jgi:hypothetical protein